MHTGCFFTHFHLSSSFHFQRYISLFVNFLSHLTIIEVQKLPLTPLRNGPVLCLHIKETKAKLFFSKKHTYTQLVSHCRQEKEGRPTFLNVQWDLLCSHLYLYVYFGSFQPVEGNLEVMTSHTVTSKYYIITSSSQPTRAEVLFCVLCVCQNKEGRVNKKYQ